jgi:hypothetical protein
VAADRQFRGAHFAGVAGGQMSLSSELITNQSLI